MAIVPELEDLPGYKELITLPAHWAKLPGENDVLMESGQSRGFGKVPFALWFVAIKLG